MRLRVSAVKEPTRLREVVLTCLFRGQDATAAFSEADAAVAFAFAVASHDDLVAVFDEAALFA